MRRMALAVAAALLLAGCGSENDRVTAVDGDPSPTPEVTESPVPTPAPSVGESSPTATPSAAAGCPKRQGWSKPAPGTTTLASAAAGGGPAGQSRLPAISGDGRYVAFRSESSTLVPAGEDTNDATDLFLYDRVKGTTKRINLSDDGAQSPGHTAGVKLSANGHWVLFVSSAANLGAGASDAPQAVLRDLRTGKNVLIPLPSEQGEVSHRSISADGRWATFDSGGSYRYDRDTGKTTRIAAYEAATISADGSTLLVAREAPTAQDPQRMLLEAHDRATGTVQTVTVAADGAPPKRGRALPYDASMSADGKLVAFAFDGPGLTDATCKGAAIYVRDLAAGTTTRVFNAPAGANSVRISGDGRFLVFVADVTEGKLYRREVFRHDLRTGATTLVSLAGDGSRATHAGAGQSPDVSSSDGSVSADGRVVAFQSDAENLAPGETGGENVYVREFDK